MVPLHRNPQLAYSEPGNNQNSLEINYHPSKSAGSDLAAERKSRENVIKNSGSGSYLRAELPEKPDN
ncbi:CIC11C00000004010 [Sungouiella intermedia]|uniref:CIC11C00000004010 n=1 Tax=Sungouiella intermedia TaxID=45354 RepID=A0A1L0BJW6_9ASCO|nr:CIC11C00000004010 [[Candida] intermedia]